MKILFKYNKEKDIWCLLNKGKSSNNSSNPTKVYQLLVSRHGENPSEQDASQFIDNYLEENNMSLEEYMKQYSADWESIADEYYKRAKNVFGVNLSHDITAYITVNNRNPYSISDNMFYVTVPRETVQQTIMHELWHFYTWYGLGTDQEEKLSKQKYNDMKEALTVLLNVECGDLMPKGVHDDGYPQHQELRKEIMKMWSKKKNIHWVWDKVSSKLELSH